MGDPVASVSGAHSAVLGFTGISWSARIRPGRMFGTPMTDTNRYGLRRHVPEDIARAVRRRCSFCCVVCGEALVQYHHFNPPFEDCTAHNPDGITLLCGTCHDKAGTLLSNVDVEAADHRRRIERVDAEISALRFSLPTICVLGSILMTGMDGPLITLEGVEVLGLRVGELGQPEVNARLFDSDGKEAVVIERNIITAREHAWDVKLLRQPQLGQATLTARRGSRDVAVELVIRPGHGVLARRINLRVGKAHISTTDTGELIVESTGGSQLCLPDYLLVAGGPIDVDANGCTTVKGGAALVPRGIPGDRYRELVTDGRFDVLVRELGLLEQTEPPDG